MRRVACLLVPDLPVAATYRADPDLVDLPLALTDGDGPHAPVTAASTAARARGVRPGHLTVTQARAIAADLVVRRRNHVAEQSAAVALADVAASLASRVELAADGAVFLDATGSRHLTGTEAGLATALVTRAGRVGLNGRAGVGAGMTVARLAARHGNGCEVVAPGAELGFLAPLSIACLEPERTLRITLERWGIHRLGELARLPEAEVATRLGAAGARLVRLARGEDERPLLPTHLDRDRDEATRLEFPIVDVEPLLFVLRGLLERLMERLGLVAVGATRLGLGLRLDDGSRDARSLPLAAPTRDVKTMLALLRLDVEGRPPRAAITECRLTVTPQAIRPTQLGLFTPAGPAPEALATTIARLGVLCASGRLGTPHVVDSHVPGRAAVSPFMPPIDRPPAGGAARLAECRLVLRAIRPPRRLEVFRDRDEPSFVRGTGLGGRVVESAGPWRIAAHWWGEHPAHRDYYDVELSDGGVYRCFRELASGRWFLDGVYD